MPFAKGKPSANPKGRPTGAKNKKTVLAENLTKLALSKGKSPLEFLLSIMENEKADFFTRVECAKAALPYCHRKQPQAVEMEANLQHSGVMLVPETPSLPTWEKRAAAAQATLKQEVRH